MAANKIDKPPSMGVAGGGGGCEKATEHTLKKAIVKLNFGLNSIFFIVLLSYKFRGILFSS